jgi:hypothetical protein
MTDMDFENLNHERISQEVRIRLAVRLERLLDDLEPMLDPHHPANLGEVKAPFIVAYLAAVKQLGSLYQVQQRPDTDSIPAARVARMVEEARILAAAEAVEEYKRLREVDSRSRVEQARESLTRALERRDAV